MSGHRRLRIYAVSYETAKAVYEITRGFPEEEKYGMSSQMRRAALSIPLNIAEGYAKRESQQEYRRFLTMALGSTNEMQVLVDFSRDIGYIDANRHEELSQAYTEIAKMIQGYIKALTSKI